MITKIFYKIKVIAGFLQTFYLQIKSAHGKGPVEFEKLKLLQDLSGEHVVGCKMSTTLSSAVFDTIKTSIQLFVEIMNM